MVSDKTNRSTKPVVSWIHSVAFSNKIELRGYKPRKAERKTDNDVRHSRFCQFIFVLYYCGQNLPSIQFQICP